MRCNTSRPAGCLSSACPTVLFLDTFHVISQILAFRASKNSDTFRAGLVTLLKDIRK